jgi:hypothetical protein
MVIGTAVFALVLLTPVPRGISLGARYGIRWFVLAAALLWAGSFLVSRRLGDAPAFALTLGFFGLTLAALWSTGVSDPSIIGGLLPWSDASGYYYDARRLGVGAPFSDFSARRPIFAGWLAVILTLTGDNLQWSLALLVAINAAACFLLARAVAETEGDFAAAFTILILLLFYRRFSGTTLTENAGIALGALGLAILWRWASTARIAILALGVFLTTLALNARAGAFFVPPSLLLWLAWRFRPIPRRALLAVGSAVFSIGLAFGVNGALGRILAPGQGMAMSNFSYTLYGQAVGGKGWTRVLEDHPELMSIAEPERSRRIYRLAIEAIRQHPGLFLRGSAKALVDFVNPHGATNLFSFIRSSNAALGRGLGYLFLALVALALAALVRGRRESRYSLLLFATAGVVASVPFVPPLDADSMRAYAASVPVLGVVMGVGIGAIASRFRVAAAAPADRGGRGILAGSLLLLLLTVGATGLVLRRPKAPAVDPARCPAPETSVSAIVSPGSYLLLTSDDSERTRVPGIRRRDFLAGLQNLGYPEIAAELSAVPAGSMIANTFDVRNGLPLWLESPRWRPPSRAEVVSFCGQPTSNASIRFYGFFRADREVGRSPAPGTGKSRAVSLRATENTR